MRCASLVLLVLVAACSTESAGPTEPTVSMDFRPDAPFFAAPFPSEHRRTGTGYRLDGLPTAAPSPYLQHILALVQETNGFASTGGIFLTTTEALDPASLPDLAQSVTSTASVFLTSVDERVGTFERLPLHVSFRASGAPSRVPNLLAALPLQGVPLQPQHTYALVVTRRVRTLSGKPLAPAPVLAAIRASTPVHGLTAHAAEAYAMALERLERQGVHDVAGLAVFRTGSFFEDFASRVSPQGLQVPMEVTAVPTLRESFPDYCVYEGTLLVPSWQEGHPPYLTEGGRWRPGLSTEALRAYHREPSRLVLTLPRRPMPSQGFPLVVFIRTGGGGDRPLVDRGVRGRDGVVLEAGAGPAREFAREGFAGVSWDGPHGGLRNVSRGDEQFLMFNVSNLGALRDNIRQTALEAVLLPRLLRTLRVDARGCTGLSSSDGNARFDTSTMALMGHSMGASIAPLALAMTDDYRAVILSGAGASWIENVVHKQRPLPVRPLAEALLRYNTVGARLDVDDPLLTLFQWALEAADVSPYAQRAAHHRHVFMIQGIVDHYILPPIANAASLSHGLELSGPSLDALDPRLAAFTPLHRLLPLRGLRVHMDTVTANREGFTRVVRQYHEDGVEDGHEVAFQRDAPKRDYRCFLRGLARGSPSIPAPEGPCAP